ncbi:MAG TPA: hypothetical protein VIF37_11990 [Methylobacter sp.]
MASRQLLLRCSTSCILAVVDPGNPCRDDGVSQTFVCKDERSGMAMMPFFVFYFLFHP